MYITQEVEVKETVVVETLCNKCGKTCKVPLDAEGKICNTVAARLKATWPYGSPKDGQFHESHICEACYDAFVATFTLPPTVKNYLPFCFSDSVQEESERLYKTEDRHQGERNDC